MSKDVIANRDTYSVKTSTDGRGHNMHEGMITNDQITKSEFCVSCHQVAVHLGIKLEIVWDQYRDSPARKAGVSCQDCHMGRSPGSQRAMRPRLPPWSAARRSIRDASTPVTVRRPGLSDRPPGHLPSPHQGPAFSVKDWLQFDWRAGWGTNEFEDKVADGKIKVAFPKRWADPLDREDARQIIEENLDKLDERDKLRKQVMENSSDVKGPYIQGAPQVGKALAFSYKIKNTNAGHNLPSGSLGAQPQLWVNVALVDPDGKNVWESGYVDSNGDMANLHSLDVAAGRIKTDHSWCTSRPCS